MNYKDLLSRTLFILSSPAKAWEQIASERDGKSVLPGFVYPMIGLCGMSEFIGTFFGKEFIPDVFQVALTHCCAVAVALFGGFFLSVYLIDKMLHKWFGTSVARDTVVVFVAYSMTKVRVGHTQQSFVVETVACHTSDIYSFCSVRGDKEVPETE